MRHMGWSYDQLMACPASYVRIIADEAAREQEAMRSARGGFTRR